MNVIFFGSSDYCLTVLQSLNTSFKLVGIITKPDQPIGRQKLLTPTPVKAFGLQHNTPVFTPKNKDELLNLKSEFQHLKADIAIVSDFGMIIPIEIFNIPKFQTLNIHFSKLPKFRGASPVQYTILHGEKNAWISIIVMDQGLDSGDIIWQKEFPLSGNENSQDLYNKLFNIASIELPDIIYKYIKNELIPVSQNHSRATYTRKLTKEDGFIPWEILTAAINGTIPAKNFFLRWPLIKILPDKFLILNFNILIRQALLAFTPWPGIWSIVKINDQGKRLKILEAHLEKNILVPDQVQLEGKKPVSWKQFLTGYPEVLDLSASW